jgi:hypothetical protein
MVQGACVIRSWCMCHVIWRMISYIHSRTKRNSTYHIWYLTYLQPNDQNVPQTRNAATPAYKQGERVSDQVAFRRRPIWTTPTAPLPLHAHRPKKANVDNPNSTPPPSCTQAHSMLGMRHTVQLPAGVASPTCASTQLAESYVMNFKAHFWPTPIRMTGCQRPTRSLTVWCNQCLLVTSILAGRSISK